MRQLSVICLALVSLIASGQTVDPKLYSDFKWRQIGPFRGGRSVACSGVPGHPTEFYMGTCGGGLWKSENAGEDWKCVTDGFLGVGVVGAIAVSSSHPDTVYIGTGEKDIRGNISHGDGVYKSEDGGKTWVNIGLRETQTVSRIVIHPTNPNIVWVAALGHVYGPNRERGIYKTTDGGHSWKQVLFESDKAGAVDIVLDPKNPDTLYSATWEAWRTPYSLNSGGPGSKIWKSKDGGEQWSDITKNSGLPTGVLGKVGLTVSPVDSKRIWALVEAKEGGLFRSDDSGTTWKKLNDDHEYTQRAWYYMRVLADPKELDTVYVLNTGMFRSKNGGTTFAGMSASHGDNHDIWIDPADNTHIIESNDGGATVTIDGGRKWSAEDFPTAQFYHVSTDNATPYNILGAQQDNSTVRIASRGGSRGIGPNDWTSTAGGESGFVVAKPNDPDIVYGGSYGGDLSYTNHRTGESRAVDPWPDNPMGHGAIDSKFRFQWTFPILFSPHDPNVLYTCSQHVHKSTNGGESWQVISPDLTRNDPKTLQSSGGPLTQDNTSVEYYGTVFTLAESPVKRGLLWAGSDDGLVNITQDGGKNWTNVTPKQMPKWGLCSIIDASPHAAGRAFLAVDNHENDDYAPYAYRTDDFGKSWKSITSGIPGKAFVRVVREDPVRPNLLYCGTEVGMFVSFDGGDHWQSFQMNLPIVPIHDLTVKDDDLILATHGRSFWSLDNISWLRQLPDTRSWSELILFRPKDADRTSFRRFGGGGRGTTETPGTQYADNPPSGIVIDYYLPKDAEKVQLSVKDKSGYTVGTATATSEKAGFNRVSVNSVRYPGYRTFPKMVTWAGRGGSIPAPPGEYTVELVVDGKTLTQPLKYKRNPASATTEADLKEQFELASKIVARVNDANDSVVRIRDVYAKVDEAVKAKPELGKEAEALKARLRPIEQAIYQTKSQSGQDPLNYPIRLNDKLGGVLGTVLSGDFRPTKQSYEVFDMLSKELQTQLNDLKKAFDVDLKDFNARLKSLGLAEIVPVGPFAETLNRFGTVER